MIRRTHTIYVTLDPFLSPHGAVLHRFDQFLAGLQEQQFPCVWVTGLTRAQLDEPRRRLGHNDPFLGESGCGVYLPQDYFHLKGSNTMRLGRFTCIPVAKPQPAAADALEELAADLEVTAVSLRSLSPRELCQNTGLRGREAEQIRMRDFDELFFFAGAAEPDVVKFVAEATVRGLTVQNLGAFWSLSCGADYAKCIRELGGLYDRALRHHALRIGIVADSTGAHSGTSDLKRALTASCDRTLILNERQPAGRGVGRTESDEDEQAFEGSDSAMAGVNVRSGIRARNEFRLHSPDLWNSLLETILERR